jgi:hypothetical protein
MLAGSLRLAGYYMGAHLIPADETNPKGFFEDDEINAINEALLAPLTPELSASSYGWRWLASVPIGAPIACPLDLASRIEAQIAHSPFCFKDPRFCYTLPAWRPFVANTVFLCVFREPARTAQSILKEYREADYLHGLSMDYAGAVAVWTLMYRHILEVHRHAGEWLFFHYDQLFGEVAARRLEAALGVAVDRQFPDAKLKRTLAVGNVGTEAAQVYEKLIELAQYPGVEVVW